MTIRNKNSGVGGIAPSPSPSPEAAAAASLSLTPAQVAALSRVAASARARISCVLEERRRLNETLGALLAKIDGGGGGESSEESGRERLDEALGALRRNLRSESVARFAADAAVVHGSGVLHPAQAACLLVDCWDTGGEVAGRRSTVDALALADAVLSSSSSPSSL